MYSMNKKPSHFQGKDPLQHIVDARLKGMIASAETHGSELPGHYSAATDAAKETSISLLILWTLLNLSSLPTNQIHFILLLFMIGYLVWKTGRSAILGYSRLERLHRLIEEERFEIEHHRDQEKEELKALYAAKGFSGTLLDEVIDVLMADDNRLLQEMLEEELGVNLESYEHPLKQAAGAFLGVLGSALIFSSGLFFLPFWGILVSAAIVIGLSAGITAQIERNKPAPFVMWNLAIGALTSLIVYFAAKIV